MAPLVSLRELTGERLGSDPIENGKRFEIAPESMAELPVRANVGQRVAPAQPRPGAELRLDIQGTAFQHQVWEALCQIPALRIRDTVADGSLVAELDAHDAGDLSRPAEPHRDEPGALVERTEHAGTETTRKGLAGWDQLLCGRWSLVRLRRAGGGLRFLALENPRGDDLAVLTPIERAVIERVASGQPNKVIAMDLELHLSSIGNIAARAMRKLGIDRRVHLAALARVLAGLQPSMSNVARANAATTDHANAP